MMLSPYIAAIQIGQLQIQSEYTRPVTAIVETAPEPHNPFLSETELKQITTPVSSIEPLEAVEIAQLEIKPEPKPIVQQRASIAGNSYARCNCTFYAKMRRPDLPNDLGNANRWYTRAQAQGIPVGSEPKIGAIGEALTGYMHVVYVEDIDGSMVTVSEWNVKGPCVLSIRTIPKTNFRYIY